MLVKSGYRIAGPGDSSTALAGLLHPFGHGQAPGVFVEKSAQVLGHTQVLFGSLLTKALVGRIRDVPNLHRLRHICMLTCRYA